MTHDQIVAALRRGYQLDDARESRRGCYPIRKPGVPAGPRTERRRPACRPELIEARALPRGLDSRGLRRSVLQIAAVLVIVCVVAALAPGPAAIRQRLDGAQPGGLGI